MPGHRVYIEPFVGGGSVLLNKPKAEEEIAGDLDKGLIKVWWSLQGDNLEPFLGTLAEFDYTEANFLEAKEWAASDFGPKQAVGYLVRNRFSRGGFGKDFAWSDRLRGGKPGDVNAWDTIRKDLPRIAERVRDVKFYACTWRKVVGNWWQDTEALYYLDPPYHHETRTAKNAYEHEMSHAGHLDLLGWCNETRAKVVLSGYRCDLYDAALKGWERREFEMPNHSGQGKQKQRRVECVWIKA